MDNLLKDSLERLLQDLCTPKSIKEVEVSSKPGGMWESLAESGFADILVREDDGGAGLSWPEAFTLFSLCGQYSAPAPLAATAFARAMLAQQGVEFPDGPITMTSFATRHSNGQIFANSTPFGAVSEWVITNIDNETYLLPIGNENKSSTGVYGSLQSHLIWHDIPKQAIKFDDVLPIREAGAVIWSAMMAGAMSEIMRLVLVHANDRIQFGKSIGKFQAIQQQISVLAESVQASMIAAQMACQMPPSKENALLIAVTKARVSELVAQVSSIGHAVHGAMGITDEFHLHYLTRRLNEWRMDFGAEGYWQEKLGRAYFESSANNGALDFLIENIDPRERLIHV